MIRVSLKYVLPELHLQSGMLKYMNVILLVDTDFENIW